MGGKSSAQKAQEKANAQMSAENAARQREIDAITRANYARNDQFMNMMGYSAAESKGRIDAEMAATEERIRQQEEASGLLTDFQNQERRRLFEAKKGVGQVDASDMSITQQMYDDAKALLDRGSSYWDEIRKAAGEQGAAAGRSSYVPVHTAYVSPSEKRGKDYEASKTPKKVGRGGTWGRGGTRGVGITLGSSNTLLGA